MKNLYRMLGILLVLAMLMSLVSCRKKVTGVDDFTEVMEDKFDCEVFDFDKRDDMDEHIMAGEDDGDYRVELIIYNKENRAEDHFEEMFESYEDGIEDDELEGTVEKTESGSYRKFVFKGEFGDREIYMIMIQTKDTIIQAHSNDTGKCATKRVDEVIKALGY